jgi:hypothetical protein
MGQVQTQQASVPGSSPVPATRQHLDLVSKFQNRLEKDPDNFKRRLISAGLAPRDHERSELEARRDHLDAALSPSPENLLPTVSALLGAFPTYGISVEAASQHAKMVCRALNDCPTWAVKEAAARFIKGEVRIEWDPSRAPTAPQIRAEAKWACLPVEAELHRLNEVLNAVIVDSDTTEDERKANVASLAKLLAEIRNGEPANERAMREVREERASQLETHRKAAKAGAE